MKTISDAQSFIDTRKLLNWLIINFSAVHRSYKQLLGESCMKEATLMLSYISNAIITRDEDVRLDYLNKYMASLTVINAFIDILVEAKQLSYKKEAEFAILEENLGKQINNWRNKLLK